MTELKRINKYISDTGYCSRRAADKLIEAGRVKVNGKNIETGFKVGATDKVTVNGKPLKVEVERIFLAFNKPTLITTTTDQKDPDNIIDFINYPQRIFPIGRLDKMSEGLIFLTNDGDIVNKILRAGNEHKKEYAVKVDKPITNDFIHQMSNGIKILGTITKKCKVRKQGKNTFNITLTQGLNRQIRRMCEKLDYRVMKLKRTRIMNVELGRLETGHWRDLTKQEMSQIDRMVQGSSGTEEMS